MAYKDKNDPRNKASRRRWYKRNREAVMLERKVRRRALHCEVAWIKAQGFCLDCGKSLPPVAMDFDHVNDDKRESVAGLCGGLNRTGVFREVAKCELVCANCHRVRTHKRRGILSGVPIRKDT